MDIVFFTKYAYSGPSSRYRVFQYLSYFAQAGYNVQVHPFFTDEYLTNQYNHRKNGLLYFLARYLHRIRTVLSLRKGMQVYVEYELAPYFPVWMEQYLAWRKIKYVVDYDDAIFHNYDSKGNGLVRWFFGNKIPTVINKATVVITGSEYLSNFAKKFNAQTVEIPTSISYKKYQAVQSDKKSDLFTIGWVGTPSSSKNVIQILPAITRFLQQHRAQLILVGFNSAYQQMFASSNIIIQQWKEEDEIATMKNFDVGIMPLDDTPFNRGKCGFKLIQYMACGLPTVFSPLQSNLNIDRHQQNLAAVTHEDWYNALQTIYNKVDYYREVVGRNNKKIVEEYYSTEANHLKLINVFKKLSAACAE